MLLDFRHLPHLKRAFPRATLPAGRRVALDRLARPPHPTCPRPAGPCRPLIRRPLPTTCPCRLESASPVRRTRRRPPAIHQRRPTTRPLLPRTALLRQTIHQLVRDTRRPLPQTTHRPLPRTVPNHRTIITLPRHPATLPHRPLTRPPVHRTVRRRPIIRPLVPDIHRPLPTICRPIWAWPVRRTRPVHPATLHHRPTHKHVLTPTVWSSGVFTVILII